MKTFIGVLIAVIFAFSGIAFAEYLACDIPVEDQNIAASEVEVDGTVVIGLWRLSTDNAKMILLDLTGIGPGRHIFRARIRDSSGWWSAWSNPLDAGKPASLGNVKVIQN